MSEIQIPNHSACDRRIEQLEAERDEADRKEQLWRAEWESISALAKALKADRDAAESQLSLLREAVRAMIQESVDTENEGLDEDDPDWLTVDTFLDHNTYAWTPTVTKPVVLQLIAALAQETTR